MAKFIVTLEKGVDIQELIGKPDNPLSPDTTEIISKRILIVKSKDTKSDVLKMLATIPGVASAETDSNRASPLDLDDESTAFVPTDPLLRKQWNLGAIGAQSAWEEATGKCQTIAIVDSGIDGTHPEFGGDGDPRMTAMPGEVVLWRYYEPVMAKIRANENPKIAPGWNFIDDNDNTFDLHRHGTSVSSVAAALGNGLGMVGVVPDARIAPYKVLNRGGGGKLSNVLKAMGKIIDSDIKIVSLSLIFWSASTALGAIMEEAFEEGILVVACSGNTNSHRIFYPAGCSHVISVGGTDRGHKRWEHGRNLGSCWPCDIMAPAGPMPVALKWRGRYTEHTGTSLAAPHVAGVAAMCRQINPDLSAATLRDILFASGNRDGTDPKWGYGEVNAVKAIQLARETQEEPEVDWDALHRLILTLQSNTKCLSAWYEQYKPEEK